MKVKQVRRRTESVLRFYGVSDKDARITTDVLLTATLKGYHGHGIERLLPTIVGFEARALRPTAGDAPMFDGVFAKIDADSGLGPLAGVHAMELAIRKASFNSVGMTGVINHGHLGSLGYYSELAAKAGHFGVVMCNSSPMVVVPGGSLPVFGTNPIAISFPLLGGGILTIDVSTAAISHSNLIAAKNRGDSLPVNVAVDSLGHMTQDPHAARGILSHGGDMKGCLLSLAISVMAGPLIGGRPNHEVTGSRNTKEAPTVSSSFLCFNIEAMGGLQYFLEANQSLLQIMQESSPDFHIPGLAAASRLRESEKQDIPMSAELRALLLKH